MSPELQHSRCRRIAAALTASAVCLLLSGCGNGLARVSGQVTLDGQPIRAGAGNVRVTVQFQPANGTGSTAIGLADENGNYSLATGSQDGIPPGDYLVTCTASELLPATAGSSTRGSRRISDPKYANAKTSGLQFTVQPGNNAFDIPLVSSAKSARTGS
jgi:hypothetical protein